MQSSLLFSDNRSSVSPSVFFAKDKLRHEPQNISTSSPHTSANAQYTNNKEKESSHFIICFLLSNLSLPILLNQADFQILNVNPKDVTTQKKALDEHDD